MKARQAEARPNSPGLETAVRPYTRRRWAARDCDGSTISGRFLSINPFACGARKSTRKRTWLSDASNAQWKWTFPFRNSDALTETTVECPPRSLRITRSSGGVTLFTRLHTLLAHSVYCLCLSMETDAVAETGLSSHWFSALQCLLAMKPRMSFAHSCTRQ